MDNPFEPPQANLWQDLPAPPESPYYRYVNYAYAVVVFVLLGSVVLAGNWSTSIADLVLTVYLLLPCVTSASMLWGAKPLQAAMIRMHLVAIAGLAAYAVFMIRDRRPPPMLVIVFTGLSLFILVWSIRLFKSRQAITNSALNCLESKTFMNPGR